MAESDFEHRRVIDDIFASLEAEGYWVGAIPAQIDRPESPLLNLARSLGEVYAPEDCDPAAPVIRTHPSRRPHAAPFDRPLAIGWHGDFASHEDRPELSLVYVTRSDPAGDLAGAWRLASAARVFGQLQTSSEGREALAFLADEPVPFAYSDGRPPRFFLAIEPRAPGGEPGLRFYEPSIVRGCMAEYGHVPDSVARALRAVKAAADEIADVRPTPAGSLLVISNWAALHDRTEQSVRGRGRDREALLAFVAHQFPARQALPSESGRRG